MHRAPVTIERGLPAELRGEAACIFDQAFGAKLGLAIPDMEKRLTIVERSLEAHNIIIAKVGAELAGIAGLATKGGAYDGGSLSEDVLGWSFLRQELGIPGALRAILVFLVMDQKPPADALHLEDIAVTAAARGRGVGTRLLDEVRGIALEEGKVRVRLDVIDTNPRAQELYARQGYVVVKTSRFGFLRGIIGFGGQYTMDLRLDQPAAEDPL